MEVAEFDQIGVKVFGTLRFGVKMAEATGLSTATISNIRKGKQPISKKTEGKVKDLFSKISGANNTEVLKKSEDGSISLANTRYDGDASFGLQLVAKDLHSNKFVKVTDVEPSLFFPAFAPKSTTSTNVVTPANEEGIRINANVVDDSTLTDTEILDRMGTRINVMDRIAQNIISGDMPSMIVYGAPGVGKSYTIMQALNEARDASFGEFEYDLIKGSVRAPGLFKALFNARNGGVVVLDDSDSVFDDEDALNLLKAALDSTDKRVISWRKESPWLRDLAEENGGEVPRNFEFKGGVIFITNVNMMKRVAKGHRMAPHYEALISRSYYVDLSMDSPRARMLRVRQVFVNAGMATGLGLNRDEAEEIVEFMSENQDRLMEVSLRMVRMVSQVYMSDAEDWKEIIEVTKMS